MSKPHIILTSPLNVSIKVAGKTRRTKSACAKS